jgi:hypothetical protein
MTNFPTDPVPRRRTWRSWPPEANQIVQQKKKPAALCAELRALTGYDEGACWRFLNKHGIERPGSKSRKHFDQRTVENLIDYMCVNGIKAAAERFGYQYKSLYNLLYRYQHTSLSRDSLTLHEICLHLHVQYSKAVEWIEKGLLKAERQEGKGRRIRYIIEFESLQKFCRSHRHLLITRRSSPVRLKFLEEFVFAPKHADLLRTRESKREGEAFERGEYLEVKERNQGRA